MVRGNGRICCDRAKLFQKASKVRKLDVPEMSLPNSINIVPIALEHVPGFWHALDVVARERKYLVLTEAPPIESTREFVMNNIAVRNPQLVALNKGEVVGWCDVRREHWPVHAHCGTLGMGLLPDYRGKGLGRRLMQATLDAAHTEGFVRVELTAHADNLRAIALYEKLGFVHEGVRRDSICIDGRFVDSVVMARIDAENRVKLLV
jgi:RimJ/RimL family protein N-acetyltransferase